MLSSLCCRCVVAGWEGEGMLGESKGDGEGEDKGVLSSSFSIICRERAGARVMVRVSCCCQEGEGVVEGVLSSGRG